MSRVKVNTINPFSGTNINFGGHAIPSSNDKNLGSEANAWAELYVSTGSINFVAGTTTVARLRAGGQALTSGIPTGQLFTETSGSLRGSFSVGRDNQASGTASLTNGLQNSASGNYSHAEGRSAIASGEYSHAEGFSTRASGSYSHAEGQNTLAFGYSSHAEGYDSIASGSYSHAEGGSNSARGDYSHAEGGNNIASGMYSHAEGNSNVASGTGAHAEGTNTVASGNYSHAEGSYTVALGVSSHAGGSSTVASGSSQTVVGIFNTHNDTTSLFIVGNGTGGGSRKDAFKVTHSSSIVVATQSAVPSWTGVEGEMVPFVSGSVYRLYAYLGGAWRSSSFA